MLKFKEWILVCVLRLANFLFSVGQPFYLKLYFAYKRKKEQKTINLLSKLLSPSMRVVDVGANVGFFSEIFAQIVPSGKVFAVEPNPNLLKSLKHVTKNYSQIELLPIALSSGGETTLDFYPSSLLNIDGRAYKNQYSMQKPVSVKAMSFDQCFKDQSVHFVKMDIQGYELVVLKGMAEHLQQNLILYLEFWPAGIREAGFSPEELLKLLASYQFEVHLLKAKGGSVLVTEQTWSSHFDSSSYFADSNILCFKAKNREQVLKALKLKKG